MVFSFVSPPQDFEVRRYLPDNIESEVISFDTILSRITNGEVVSSSEFLPYLCLERREKRANVNMLLAKAYWQSGREENLQYAKVFIQRAWLLSRFSLEWLPLFVEIHSALDDIPGIREAYKRVGMEMARQGNVAEAIRYFDLWQYAYANFKSLDKYEYDFDILESMDRLAKPHRFSPKLRTRSGKDGRIRVAYLVKGVLELGSVLVMINLLYARFHDRLRVEPMFFVPESEEAVLASLEGKKFIKLFEGFGCKLLMGPNTTSTEKRLRAVSRMIHDAHPDILVTSAGLGSFEHYFIACLRPAPVTIGFIQGPPQQFAPPSLDWGIAWSKHPLMDSPVSCSLLKMELDLPEPSNIVPYDRHELDIPDRACVLATAGRHVKFQEPEFWRAIIDLLNHHADVFYLAMGVEESQLPFLSSMLPPELRSRIRFLRWQGNEYLRTLCLADILIDTFPSGGGTVLSDAMALGIPVVSFMNNYLKLYDQTDWSPAEEFEIPEIVVSRGDFIEMKRTVSRLIEDEDYRRRLGLRCQQYLLQTRGKPERAVRKCEEIYDRVLRNELSVPSVKPRSVWQRIARTADQLKGVFGEKGVPS